MASTDDHDAPADAGMPVGPDPQPPAQEPAETGAAVASEPVRPVKRAARKRVAKATADPADAGEPVGSEAGTPAPARKRATRKKAAPTPQPPVLDPAQELVAVEPGLGPAPAPATAQVTDEAAAPDLTETGPVDADTGELDAAAAAADATPDEQTTAVPSFGLLFQAPEPVAARPRTRSRAATAAAEDAPDEPAESSPADSAPPAEDEDDDVSGASRRRRRRGGKGRRTRPADADATDAGMQAGVQTGEEPGEQGGAEEVAAGGDGIEDGTSRRRTRRRRRSGSAGDGDDTPGVTTKVREPRRERDEVVGVRGSTRLEAKKQRRREGREAGRRRTVITEAEFLARRESVERVMLVREKDGRTQIGVLEDGVLVEHYVSRETNASMAGNIYLGKVQNVLPSMEAAFVDIGKGRNAVLYAGEVNWDAAGLASGSPRRIENALESGQSVLVQVTKDPIGHKGARLTSQISLPGRFLVYVPDSSMTGISRKLPDTERSRLKSILREVVPGSAGVIVRTAAEGASEEELRADVERLTQTWEQISTAAESAGTGRKGKGSAPQLLHGEPDLTVRVVRDVFNEDFTSLVVAGEAIWSQVSDYVASVAPDLAPRLTRWTGEEDLFAHHRVDEQIAKAMDRKVWLPSGGSLVIDRTEAMTVIDVNTGKFVGSGGNLEETVTRNNIEAAEEIVRQLRLRDIGGIIVIDFIDMVLESNRDLVVRRLMECLGRDRTKHQVAEVTSLGLVQMTRKRVGAGLIEVFSEPCEHCHGRGYLVHSEPVDRPSSTSAGTEGTASPSRSRSRRGRAASVEAPPSPPPGGPTPAQIAAAAHAAAVKSADAQGGADDEPGMPPGAGPADPPQAATVGQPSDVPDAGAPDTDVPDPLAAVAGSGEPLQRHDWADPAAPAAELPEDQARPDPPAQQPEADGAATWDSGTEADGAPPAYPSSTARGGRARRRRGRVVAPAGPPPAALD